MEAAPVAKAMIFLIQALRGTSWRIFNRRCPRGPTIGKPESKLETSYHFDMIRDTRHFGRGLSGHSKNKRHQRKAHGKGWTTDAKRRGKWRGVLDKNSSTGIDNMFEKNIRADVGGVSKQNK